MKKKILVIAITTALVIVLGVGVYAVASRSTETPDLPETEGTTAAATTEAPETEAPETTVTPETEAPETEPVETTAAETEPPVEISFNYEKLEELWTSSDAVVSLSDLFGIDEEYIPVSAIESIPELTLVETVKDNLHNKYPYRTVFSYKDSYYIVIHSTEDMLIASWNVARINSPDDVRPNGVCKHGIHDYNDETHTVEFYEGVTVQQFISDANVYYCEIKLFYNGTEVTYGELQDGTVIQVFHGGELFGEYTAVKVD